MNSNEPTNYICWDAEAGVDSRLSILAESAKAAAEQYIEDAGYENDCIYGPTFAMVYVAEDLDDVECFTIIVDPVEPQCVIQGHEHNWIYQSTVGHGGGVRILETCEYCDTERLVNTWDTNPSDGTQGWRTTTYRLGSV